LTAAAVATRAFSLSSQWPESPAAGATLAIAWTALAASIALPPSAVLSSARALLGSHRPIVTAVCSASALFDASGTALTHALDGSLAPPPVRAPPPPERPPVRHRPLFD
jgi:hypothetical protein